MRRSQVHGIAFGNPFHNKFGLRFQSREGFGFADTDVAAGYGFRKVYFRVCALVCCRLPITVYTSIRLPAAAPPTTKSSPLPADRQRRFHIRNAGVVCHGECGRYVRGGCKAVIARL
jgi:hypothetical protein